MATARRATCGLSSSAWTAAKLSCNLFGMNCDGRNNAVIQTDFNRHLNEPFAVIFQSAMMDRALRTLNIGIWRNLNECDSLAGQGATFKFRYFPLTNWTVVPIKQ